MTQTTGEITTQRIVSGADWPSVYARAQELVPEAFTDLRHVLNLIGGEWGYPGNARLFNSPCDGTPLCTYPMLDAATAQLATQKAAQEFEAWARTDLDERRTRTAACIKRLHEHRELLALLLCWEIGKPYAQSLVSVDRCVSGVEWYIEEIAGMLEGRQPIGLISNIASWNYPLSVLVHAMLVQALAGNSVIAKTPTDGGLCTLTVAVGIARQCGLPVSLVSGSGSQLSGALVRGEDVACLAFVGGRTSGRDIAAGLVDQNRRYMLEMEGLNAYGIWEFSDWPTLGAQIKKGFEFAKQRCTAYPRYVIQRKLFPQFLQMYLPIVSSLRVGHPLLGHGEDSTPPTLDFGPLINSTSAEEIRDMVREAVAAGALPLYEGTLDDALFFSDQDRSPYVAPVALLGVPRNCALYHKEPFGPVDSIVVVDRVEELVAEMNVSNGNLVASVACDDPEVANRIACELRAFKVGVNRVRSRGDREEPFGGIGESWKGAFVGGRYLVTAVTEGEPGERLHGNFPSYTLLPDVR